MYRCFSSLGMHHDGTGNNCARDGYIMSPSRGTNGEASWSTCSARVVAELQYSSFIFCFTVILRLTSRTCKTALTIIAVRCSQRRYYTPCIYLNYPSDHVYKAETNRK